MIEKDKRDRDTDQEKQANREPGNEIKRDTVCTLVGERNIVSEHQMRLVKLK